MNNKPWEDEWKSNDVGMFFSELEAFEPYMGNWIEDTDVHCIEWEASSTTSQNTQQNPFKNKNLTRTHKTCALFFDATFSQHAGFDVQQLAAPDSPRSFGYANL